MTYEGHDRQRASRFVGGRGLDEDAPAAEDVLEVGHFEHFVDLDGLGHALELAGV
jgi:hypothetical protein